MSLTVGRGPFSRERAGTLNFEPPGRVVLVEPFRRRVRAVKGGQTVIDSDDVKLVFTSGRLPHYSFPAKDVHVASKPDSAVAGNVTVEWDDVDAWYEEDERVVIHPKDPYHRIDTLTTSRKVDVSVNGTLVASTTRAKALYETALPIRWYIPRADVDFSLLVPSPTVTQCPYKGTAQHFSASIDGHLAEDVAWSYEYEIHPEGAPVQWMIAFYNERVDLEVDGAREQRPHTAYSR